MATLRGPRPSGSRQTRDCERRYDFVAQVDLGLRPPLTACPWRAFPVAGFGQTFECTTEGRVLDPLGKRYGIVPETSPGSEITTQIAMACAQQPGPGFTVTLAAHIEKRPMQSRRQNGILARAASSPRTETRNVGN